MTPQLAVAGGPPLRSSAYPRWPIADAADRDRLVRVLETGTWASDGPLERQFERAFAERHGASDAVTVSNGSVSLVLCLRSLGIKPGDEVIVPALTWTATAACALEVNAIPVFADVDPRSFCMDPASVEALITKRTVALLPVHLYSHMADMDALMRIAGRHGLAVIEDCAHAHGARWRGRAAGSIGAMGSFSFQSSKIMTAGEGGAITSSQKRHLDSAYSQRNSGRHGAERGTPVLGGNYRMTEFQSAVLLGQLARLDDQRRRRDQALDRLRALVRQLPGVSLLEAQPAVDDRPQYRFSFAYDRNLANGIPLPQFVQAVRAEGVPVEHTYPVVYRNPLYRPDLASWAPAGTAQSRPTRCPQAERIAEAGGFTLAHHALLGTEQDVEDVARAMAKVLEHPAEAAGAASQLRAAARDILRVIR